MNKYAKVSYLQSLRYCRDTLDELGGIHVILYFLFWSTLSMIAFFGPFTYIVYWMVVHNVSVFSPLMTLTFLFSIWFLSFLTHTLYQATVIYLLTARKKENYL